MRVKDFITLNLPVPPDVFKLAVDRAYNQIIITDIDGVIVYANKGLERITGFKINEVIGHKPNMWGGSMDVDFYKELWQCIKKDKKPFHHEIRNHRKDGSTYYAILTITPILDYNDILSGFIGIEEEVTVYKDVRAKLEDYARVLELQINSKD
jgi:PAS domain S-box-containing protein